MDPSPAKFHAFPMGKQKKTKGAGKGLRPWYLRQWRKSRHLTLEQLAFRIDTTGATISRLERGKQPYSQPMLEALAEALQCQPGDLIMRPPGAADRIMAVFSDMSPETQKQALAVVQALKDGEKAA
jgi:transcriptional regulator with XRE-family HTH domain